MNTGIVVLGMHRSGTSLVAELVYRWGAFGRVDECLPSNKWNARGYWELAALVDLNTRLLGEVGASWSFPPGEKHDPHLAALAQRSSYREEALALLASMQSKGAGGWFWKDPRLSLLLPFWKQLWGDVRYVICVRDPLEIYLSLHVRDNLSFSVATLLWNRYMQSILRWTRGTRRQVVSYTAILRNPAQECTRLAQFLGDNVSAVDEMQKSVDTELRHFRAGRPPVANRLSKKEMEFYSALEDAAAGRLPASGIDLNRYALPRSWHSRLYRSLLLQRCGLRCNRMFPVLASLWQSASEADTAAIE
jgi:hypothetical protein